MPWQYTILNNGYKLVSYFTVSNQFQYLFLTVWYNAATSGLHNILGEMYKIIYIEILSPVHTHHDNFTRVVKLFK